MNKLVKFYDKILNSEGSSFVTIAISWLHVVRPNVPGYLDNISSEKSIKFFSLENILSIIKNFLLYSFYKIKKIKYSSTKIKNSIGYDTLIFSHCLNQKTINNNNDFYFGDLERIVKTKNFRPFKLLINHTNINSEFFNSINKIENHFVLEKYLNIYDEIKILLLQIKEFLRLKFSKVNSRKNKKVINNICLSIFDKQTTFALRIYFLAKKYLEEINPSTIIFTYEGYGWERVLVFAAKEFNPNIKIIGCQHPLVSEKNFAMLRNIKGNFNPDILWVQGNKSLRALKNANKLKNIKIIKTGTFKKLQKIKKSNKIKPNCLVVPGATISENIKLFSFSLSCAKKNKAISFTWRVHPLIKLEKILQIIKISKKTLPKNIILSKSSLSKDVSKNSFVLYTDSAAVIEATRGSNIPLYLNLKGQKNNDPLFDYANSKIYIHNIEEFLKIFTKLPNKKLKITKKKAEKIFFDIYERTNRQQIFKSLKENDFKKI